MRIHELISTEVVPLGLQVVLHWTITSVHDDAGWSHWKPARPASVRRRAVQTDFASTESVPSACFLNMEPEIIPLPD
jgi:hypothetical protein